MAHAHHTRRLARTEEALTVLFCLIDDAYCLLNPHGGRYQSLKRLSDSEVTAPLPSSSCCGAWRRASARSCGTPRGGSSRTCSPAW